MIFLNNEQIQERLEWSVVLTALEAAFRTRAENPTAFQMTERLAIGHKQNTYLTMPCTDAEGWFGVKQVSGYSKKSRAWQAKCSGVVHAI